MSVRWDFFVNAYDTHRYLPAAGLEGRENRNLAFVREFAGAVSILQVCDWRIFLALRASLMFITGQDQFLN